MALFTALRHRPFTLLWGGQAVSQLGDSLYALAIAWFVLEETASAAASGLMLSLSFIPRLSFLVVGGLAANRYRRPAVMLAADVVRGLLAAALAGLAAGQRLEMWHLYAAGVAFGLAGALFEPAATALVPEVTPAAAWSSANALNSLRGLLLGAGGPGLAALVVDQYGVPAALALNALSFVVSALCLFPLLRLTPDGTGQRSPRGALVDLGEGLRFVFASRWLWLSLGILALVNLTGRSPMNVSLPFLVQAHFGADVRAFGLLQAAFSLGSALGAVALGRARQVRRRGRLIFAGLVVVGAMTSALGLPIPLPAGLLSMLVLAAALSIVNLAWTHLLQARVPAAVRGRVVSIGLLGSNGLLPLGFALAGWATDQLGPALVFLLGGALTLALALLGLASHDTRHLD